MAPNRGSNGHSAEIDPFDSTTQADPASVPSVTQASVPPPVRVRDPELAPGEALDDYVIEAKVAHGGMGTIYAAVHHVIAKRAAIKVLRQDPSGDELAVDRFVAEARIVNEIGHPNIVDVFAFGKTRDGRSYLAMEWLQGESLRTRLARGRLEIEEACRIVLTLVRALAAAHAKGVVHRDLKPDNVFLVETDGESPRVKLLDFGIAKLLRPDHNMQQTASGVLVGTPMYIAPEQARGQPVDARADIYALGGVMFEMITGRPPFLGATSFEVVSKHLTEAPPHVSSLVRVPRELDALLDRMLAKHPARRPALSEVASVLDALMHFDKRPTSPLDSESRDSAASAAVTARRVATPLPSTRTPVRARRVRAPIWAALLILVLGASAAYVIVGIVRRSDRQLSIARADAQGLAVMAPVIVAAPPDAMTADAAAPTDIGATPPPSRNASKSTPPRPRHATKPTAPRPAATPASSPQPRTPAVEPDGLLERGSLGKTP